MALEGLGDDSLKRVVDIKNNIKETGDEVRNLNKEFKELGIQTVNLSGELSKINQSANKFADIQNLTAKGSKATVDAVKEENKQRNIAREISLQIEDLNKRALRANEKEAKVLYAQANALGNAKSNATSLADSFEQLSQDAASIDRRTEFFTGLSEVVKDIPGLRKLSGPFQEAAKASRQTVIDNAKRADITSKIGKLSKEELKTGKGLSKERLKQMGLADITGKSSGTAAASTLKKAMAENKARSVGLAGMKAGFKALGPMIRAAFGPIGILLTVVSAVKAIFKAMMAGSKEVTDFRKSFGVSRDAAVEIRDRTFEISEQAASFADTQGEVLILQKQITEQLALANQSLGTAIDFTRELGREFGGKLLVQSALLKDNIGLSTSAIGELQKETIRTGQDVEDLTKEMEGTVAATSLTKGFMLDVKQIMEEVTKVQGELRLNFGNSNTELSKAVTQAKLLGFELSDLQGPASKLLDFESSIASELEAELLTGKNLNLEKARQAALDGDLVTLGQEITKQGVDYTQLQEMNVVQRKAFADAVGLSVDQLANTLKKQEEFNALQQRAEMAGKRIANIENKSMKEIYDDLQKQGASEEKIKEILGERLFATQKAEDAQQKFNKALESVKEKFTKMFDGDAAEKFGDGMIQFAEFINKFVTSVNKKGLGRTIFFGIDEEPTEKQVKQATQFNSLAEKNAMSAGRNPGATMPIGLKDFVLKPLDKDTITMAGGTKLGGNVEELLKELISAVKQGGDVYMDSTKVGTAMSVGTYKVQ